MRNLVFVALLATAALSMGCNGIHKRHGGCGPSGCGAGGGCPDGACGGHAGGYGGDQYAGNCGPGGCGVGGGHGGHGGHGFLGHGGPGSGQHGMRGVPHHFSREYNGPPGPSAAQVAYPYYTTRGPRDYFYAGPSTIGP